MRVRNKPWAEEYIKQHEGLVVLNPEEQKGNWKERFDQPANPLHLEIGSGRGGFIRGMAEKNQDVNFIGIEIQKNIIVHTIDEVKDSGVSNVRLIHADANHLQDFFNENELSTIYLNFSDPWPKNRHEKRRLTYKSFLNQYQQILKPDGMIVMKTDNRQLFEYSLVSFSQAGFELGDVSLDLHAETELDNVMTEYEAKFSEKGQPIFRCIVHNRQ